MLFALLLMTPCVPGSCCCCLATAATGVAVVADATYALQLLQLPNAIHEPFDQPRQAYGRVFWLLVLVCVQM